MQLLEKASRMPLRHSSTLSPLSSSHYRHHNKTLSDPPSASRHGLYADVAPSLPLTLPSHLPFSPFSNLRCVQAVPELPGKPALFAMLEGRVAFPCRPPHPTATPVESHAAHCDSVTKSGAACEPSLRPDLKAGVHRQSETRSQGHPRRAPTAPVQASPPAARRPVPLADLGFCSRL